MVWTFAAAVVLSMSLLVRVLLITRLLKRKVTPAWLPRALAVTVILAATCLLTALTGPNAGR